MEFICKFKSIIIKTEKKIKLDNNVGRFSTNIIILRKKIGKFDPSDFGLFYSKFEQNVKAHKKNTQ